MDKDLFEYEMKKRGYKTPKLRADFFGWSISQYYRRIRGVCECTKDEIARTAALLGWDVARRIFFGE